MTLADIARAADLDRSATQRLVYTLETLGYLKRIEGTRNYGLTSKVLQFSHSYLKANDLIDRASPYLLEISRNLGETTNLHELDGHEVVFVARFPGAHLINIDIVIGSRLPTFFTASGTAILSALPEEERLALLERTPLEPLTPFTVTDPKALLERVRVAAQRGYAVIMYAAIRQAKAKSGSAEELARRIKDGAVPIISDVDGFRAYYVVYAGDDTVTAISIFDKFEQAEEANRRAIAWIEKDLGPLLAGHAGVRQLALLVAGNLALNLAFFATHPVFTQYYIIPILMLSLWTLLFAAVLTRGPARGFIAQKSDGPRPREMLSRIPH